MGLSLNLVFAHCKYQSVLPMVTRHLNVWILTLQFCTSSLAIGMAKVLWTDLGSFFATWQ